MGLTFGVITIHRDHARTMIKACCKILCTDDALAVSRSSVQATWNDIVIVLLHLMASAEGPLYLGILRTYARRGEVISHVLVSSAGPWRHRLRAVSCGNDRRRASKVCFPWTAS